MGRGANWSRWARELTAVLSVIVLVPALFLSAERVYDSGTHKGASDVVELAFSDHPYVVRTLVEPLFAPGSEEHAAIQAILSNPPQPALDGPVAIHLLRLYGKSVIPRSDLSSGADVLALLTGHNAHDANPSFPVVQTRTGARYRPAKSVTFGENHRDVFLATFAECGVPLSLPLHASDGPAVTAADLLRDSIANFHLGQKEIAWTAIAYVLYMPGTGPWQNRDGERFTWDQLAGELMRRELRDATCGGTHLLLAMTYLARVDASLALLLPATREALNTTAQR